MIYAGLGDGNASRGQLLSSSMGEWIWRKDNDKVRVLMFSFSSIWKIIDFYGYSVCCGTPSHRKFSP